MTWKTRGHTKKEAWRMACKEVLRVFEEMQSARCVARDSRDGDDTDYTTATMIFATLKCHGVMTEYVQAHFLEHPSISAVLARHLADNYTKPDDNQGKKLATLQGLVEKLTQRCNKIECNVVLKQDKK
jgi:precorrin-2 methylase